MTDVEKFYRSSDQTVPAGDEWQPLRIDDDGSLTLCTGPTTFVAYASLSVAGLGDHALQVRYATVNDYSDDRSSTVESWYPIKEIIGTAGSAFDELVFVNEIPASGESGAKLRVRLYAKSPDVDATVTAITARCLHS
jgi:hypothetical protein